MKIVAIMPLKLKNERLPGKNTKLLGNIPLFLYQINAVKKAQVCDDIYVFCSDESIKNLLPSNIIFLKRDAVLDLPTSNFTLIFQSFMSIVDADIYIYVHATAPFISSETIKECVESVKSNKHDSSFCAVKIQDFLWCENKPLNFDATNIPRSQDLKPIFRETSGVYVFTKDVFKKYKRRIGLNPFIKEVSYKEAVDINEPQDFKLAEALLNKNL